MNRPAELAAAGQRGKWDTLAGAILREDSARFTDIYCLLLCAARAESIDRDHLPDCLDLEDGGEFALLGQAELGTSVFESALRDQIARSAAAGDWPEQDTEQIILVAARVGQHVFALNVLTNCGRRVCLLHLKPISGRGQEDAADRPHQAVERQLGHRASGPAERPGRMSQPRRGLRPGMLTVTANLKIHIPRPPANAVRRRRYLDWHRQTIFVA
jgi:hypothetical protein